MLLIYTPESGERREWQFQPYEAWSFETELVESVGGQMWISWDGFLSLLRVDNTKAKRALLWVMLRRDKPDLRFVDLVTKAKEITIGLDVDERADLRRRLDDPEETWTQAERELAEDALSEYPDYEPEPERELGKEQPSTVDTAGP